VARAQSGLLKAPAIEQQIYSRSISSKSLILFIFLFQIDFACLKILYINADSESSIFVARAGGDPQHLDFIGFFRLSRSWHGLCKGLII